MIVFQLTRDFRTSDALTLYAAYEYTQKNNKTLCPVFRFNPQQIDPKKNSYFSSNAVQFMCESLEQLSKKMNISFVEGKSDQEYINLLKSNKVERIFIARDFTPFARKRVQLLESVCPVEEIDDITVHPMDIYKVFTKLGPFISFVEKMDFPEPIDIKVDWLKETHYLPSFHGWNKKFHHFYTSNPNLMVHPDQLDELIDHLKENTKGYAQKKIREQIGDPKVSYLSAFIKFGLVSIRQIHALAYNQMDKADGKAFSRELYFRDFFYCLAWNHPEKVFDEPNWTKKHGCPKIISSYDASLFKGCSESKEAEKIYEDLVNGQTEYDLINAGVNQLVETGYLLNRLRMLLASYLTRDKGLWWKYAEKFYANHLTDYDWTINALNHQNIAKIGLYPKYTQDFSIERQESMNKVDKQKYLDEYLTH
jgi:deoxyribodipyrimidine photo-lyase